MPEGFSQRLHLVMIDIDHFKRVNDTYGHMCDDAVLKEMSYILKAQTRGADKVVRWGGEEFMILVKSADRDAIEARWNGFALRWRITHSPTTRAITSAAPAPSGFTEYHWLVAATTCPGSL